MSRLKITYRPTRNDTKPVRCYLGNNKVHLTADGMNEADAYKQMCRLVKRLYKKLPEMRTFLYERGKP